DAPGPYAILFHAANALPGDAVASISVSNVDRPPVVTAPATVTAVENEMLTLTVSASDPDGEAIVSLTADLSALPPGNDAVFTPGADHASGSLTWTPSYADAPGPYTVSFTAANALSGSASTSISVSDVDRAPIVSVAASVTATENGQLSLTVSASD